MISVSILSTRARMLRSIREFFTERGFLEVQTPVRIPAPAHELHIDAAPAGERFLRTSPELHMKRLLAAGCERLFQMGPCFREGESGPLHNPEFTLLEWYRAGAGYRDVLDDARELLRSIGRKRPGGGRPLRGNVPIDFEADWAEITVERAFLDYAGWNPVAAFDADRFDLDLVGKVEPRLPRDRPVVLLDYPAPLAALARCRGAPAVAERWELYAGGVELANAFSELTDAAEQKRRFLACRAQRRALGKATYPMDNAFLEALARGLPECAGVALGVDRLAMVMTGAADIAEVRPFCRE